MNPKHNVRAIVTADWHGDAVTAGTDRYQDIEDTAREVLRHAIRSDRAESRSLFVFAGDLTDPDPPRCWRAVRLGLQIATKAAQNGIPSIWITGNHDVLEDGFGSNSLMALESGDPLIHTVSIARMVEPFRVDRNGVDRTMSGERGPRVLCFPYVPRALAYNPLDVIRHYADQPPPDLIVSHLMLEGISVGSETKDFARGRDLFLPIDELRKVWPNVPIVNGHYHAGQVFRSVHIPGSIARLTLGEQHNSPRFLEILL